MVISGCYVTKNGTDIKGFLQLALYCWTQSTIGEMLMELETKYFLRGSRCCVDLDSNLHPCHPGIPSR